MKKGKNIITNNLILKFVSLVVALLLWILIVNAIDPTTTRSFRNVEVEVLNENVILGSNHVYTILDGDKVDFTVKGKRSEIEGLTADDFSATADLSKLSTINTTEIDVSLNADHTAHVEIDSRSAVMRISLEEKVSEKFRVTVDTEGELDQGYVLGDVSCNPSMVEVSGPASVIEKIDHVGALVTLNGEKEGFDLKESLYLYDASGGVMDSNSVTLSKKQSEVSIQILPVVEVPIHVNVSGTPAEGYVNTGVDYTLKSVGVAGDEKDIRKIKKIEIPISVEGASEDVVKEVELSEYLPDGCKLKNEGDSVLVITCDIQKKGQRAFTFSNSDITVNNLSSDDSITFTNSEERHKLVILGRESKLQKITMSDLKPSMDVTGLSEGTYRLLIQFELPAGVRLKKNVTAEVMIYSSSLDGNGAASTEAPS